MNNVDWNDLQYVVAVTRNGSAAGAARALNVSHATVLRRVQALEQIVGSPLFERLPTGYAPTEAGQTLSELGMSIETALTDTGRLIEGRNADLAGLVRFTTTDSLAYFLLPPILASFQERYPSIEVELTVTNNLLDLDRRDADLTLRPSMQPPESWIGMRLPQCHFGVYATPAYLESRPGVPWQDLDWLLPGGPLALSPANLWLRSLIGDRKALLTVDSFVGLHSLALANLGATILPKLIANAHPGLTLLCQAAPAASVDLWLLTHANLRQSGRIRVLMEHMAREIRSLLPALSAHA